MFEAQVYHGYRQAFATLRDVEQEHGPFDGVLGFSQGAVACHLLLALQLATVEDTDEQQYVPSSASNGTHGQTKAQRSNDDVSITK